MGGGTNRGIALGISQGFDNFLNSYMQVKNMQSQEKYRKIAPQLELLKHIVDDENIPFKNKIEAMDTLQNVLGVKDAQPLSVQLGLKELMKEQIEVSPEEVSQDKEPSWDNYLAEIQAGVSIGEINGKLKKIPAQYKTRGELSSNDFKLIRELKAKKQLGKQESEQSKEAARFQFDLQEKSYKANGYKVTSEGTNAEGEYVQILTNNSGDTKINKLPKGFEPLGLLKAKQNQKNRGSSTLKTLEDYFETQINPNTGNKFTEEEAQVAALAKFNENYQAGINAKNSNITRTDNINTGSTPISPTGKEDDRRANQQMYLTLQGQLDTAKSKATESSSKAKLTANEANAFYKNNVQKQEEAFWRGDFDETDDQFKTLENNKSEYQRLKSIADDAAAEDTGNKTLLNEVQTRLDSFNGNSTSSPQLDVSKYKNRINKFKRRNANRIFNGTKVSEMSDEQILQIVVRAKKEGKF